MPKCKQCATTYSIWTATGDGLCKACHEKVSTEAALGENERKNRTLADTQATIDAIARAMAGDEQPISVVFLHANVQQKSSGFLKKLPGMVAGVAIGGTAGEMIFGGSLFSNTATFAGELDVLVVTSTRLLIGYCVDTPFFSQNAEINTEHLQLLLERCKEQTIGRVECRIATSHVSSTATNFTIVFGDRKISLQKSELYVNNTIHQTPSLPDICTQLKQFGTRPTPTDFTTKLLAGESPLPDSQVSEAVEDHAYIEMVCHNIITHRKRDTVVQKFPILTSSLKNALEKGLQTKADAFQMTQFKLIVYALLAVIAVVGIVVTEGFINFLCVVGAIIIAIASIVQLVSLYRSAWCRDIMKTLR